jgi:hypothetical protein
MDNVRIPLSEVLNVINAEIQEAHHAAQEAGHTAVMRFVDCELEFAVDVEAKAGGGFHIWVLKLGGSAKRSESNTIKIRYKAAGDWSAKVEAEGGTLGEKYERTGTPELLEGGTPGEKPAGAGTPGQSPE